MPSCGLWVAYNRGYLNTWEEIDRTLERWVQLDSDKREQPFRDAIETIGFSYIDGWQGHRLAWVESDDEQGLESVFKVVDRKHTELQYNDKRGFAMIAKAAGVEGDLVPRTFFTKQEAMEKISPDDVDVLFVKDVTGTFGRGISLISFEELKELLLPKYHIIQEGLTRNLALVNGTRVTVRGHFVIMGGRIFCHHRGFVQVHTAQFDPQSKSRDVQVSHQDYTTFNLDMRFPRSTPAFLNETVVGHTWKAGYFDLESVQNGTKWMQNIVNMGPKLGQMWEPIVRMTQADPSRFAFWGADLIPMEDGSFKMLEINTYPAFKRFDVMTDVILTALGLQSYDNDIDTRLVELWKLPESDTWKLPKFDLAEIAKLSQSW
ncbi:MAG: hypothetical protein SGARI_000720 [Bacillariaceae sp.]